MIIHPPASEKPHDPPGYIGHHGGTFGDAGYSSGRGGFGFRHDTINHLN